MREEFLFAAELYLSCGHKVEAAACLQNAREYLLAAGLWEKVGQVCIILVKVTLKACLFDVTDPRFSHKENVLQL